MGNRDPESFDDFYAGSVGRVISQLYAMTGDRAEAEDVVQEAYTRAWERWAKIARYADPESWGVWCGAGRRSLLSSTRRRRSMSDYIPAILQEKASGSTSWSQQEVARSLSRTCSG
jgi:DNA-directed RNA polymerase specialized sigma24 family protein